MSSAAPATFGAGRSAAAPEVPARLRWTAEALRHAVPRRPAVGMLWIARLVLGGLLPLLIWFVPDSLSTEGRLALIVLCLAITGWTMSGIGDTAVSLAAAIALALTGVITTKELFSSLGHELIWLIMAAFIMAAVLKASGLTERALVGAAKGIGTVGQLFYVMTGLIAATAFVIPSTSGRAALMLPVFLSLAAVLRSPVVVRALALLFPTIILLSACGSLIGAGAHLVAVDIIERSTGERIDYLGWLALNLPFALASSFAATWIILRLYLTPAIASRRVDLSSIPAKRLTRQQALIALTILATVALWITGPLHGLSIALVALAGTFVMLQVAGSLMKTKDAFKSVEVELIVFLATTFVIADALAGTGADKWMAGVLLGSLPSAFTQSLATVIVIVAVVSLLAHLVITSRTARASVLIPAFTLPLAALGHDPKLLIILTAVGTGFCQTMTTSAKPVAIFSRADVPTYSSRDLMRLSLALLPMMLALLLVFAFVVWPLY